MPQSYFILENWIFQIETTVYFGALSQTLVGSQRSTHAFFYYKRYKQTPCGMNWIFPLKQFQSVYFIFFLVVHVLPKGMLQDENTNFTSVYFKLNK